MEYNFFLSGHGDSTEIVNQESTFCNNELFIDYVKNVICVDDVENRRKLMKINHRFILLMDQFTSHCAKEVTSLLKLHSIDIVLLQSHC